MHTEMWEHAAVQENLATLRRRGVHVLDPEDGRLAGGDVGPGRLADPARIADTVLGLLAAGRPLAGRRVVVTAGGTREALDPVRFVGNRSSGKMGHALANVAARVRRAGRARHDRAPARRPAASRSCGSRAHKRCTTRSWAASRPPTR